MMHGKTAQARRRRTRRTVALVAAVALAVSLWFAWDAANVEAETPRR